MRLKEYGRNRIERKEYNHQSGILLFGVDVSWQSRMPESVLWKASGLAGSGSPIISDYNH